MHEIFKNYCRLCGKNNDEIKNILNPDDNSSDLCKTIEKHFSLQIQTNNQAAAPKTVCNECKDFILKLIEFEGIVLRTQTKFQWHEVKREEGGGLAFKEEHQEELFEASFETLKKFQLSCEICNETFNTQLKLRKHLKSDCATKKVSCNICGNEYSNQSKLLTHRKSQHSEVRRFVCDECGKAFKGSGDLARHKEFHRDETDTPFHCSICGKKFKSKLVKAMHEKNHGDNRCTCSICGLELKTKNTLRGHMLMHSDELQFKCERCDKRFRHKKNLSVHLLTHSGVQPFTCAFCHQSFSLRFNLRTHQKKIHPEETANYEREGKATIITDVVKKKFACGQRQAKSLCSQ